MVASPAATKRTVTFQVAELFPAQGEWAESDYFSLPDTNRLMELNEGLLIMPPHPTQSHQYSVLELAVQLRRFVQPRDLGEVYVAPLPVRLWSGKVREPDVLFMAKEHADRMAEQYFGPPDLVMEVTSPSTIHTDRAQKAAEYARAGIREYWLIDPNARTVEVLALAGQKYEPAGAWSVGENARSAVLIGFEVVVARLFRTG